MNLTFDTRGRIAEAENRIAVYIALRNARVRDFTNYIATLDVSDPSAVDVALNAAKEMSIDTTHYDEQIAKADADLALWRRV